MKHASLGLLLISLTALSAFAQKQQSDREFQRFKGPVKAVTVERAKVTESASGPVEGARQTNKMLTFDADGNLLTDKAYSQGEEFDIRTYKVIDGERVVKLDVLTKRVLSGVGPGNPSGKPSDPRYSAKIKYKYDSQGNRTEMTWVDPGDVPTLRYVYRHEGNRKEVSVYRSDGSFSHGYVDTLDEKGNEVETESLNRQPNAGTKTKYTYLEFDSQGNWIKRSEQRGDSSWITYRTITYY